MYRTGTTTHEKTSMTIHLREFDSERSGRELATSSNFRIVHRQEAGSAIIAPRTNLVTGVA